MQKKVMVPKKFSQFICGEDQKYGSLYSESQNHQREIINFKKAF